MFKRMFQPNMEFNFILSDSVRRGYSMTDISLHVRSEYVIDI